jgi:cytochrome b561
LALSRSRRWCRRAVACPQAAIALHFAGQFLIYGLVALHIGAALMHGFIRRDGILERMLPRRA